MEQLFKQFDYWWFLWPSLLKSMICSKKWTSFWPRGRILICRCLLWQSGDQEGVVLLRTMPGCWVTLGPRFWRPGIPSSCANGTEGIERIAQILPDVALIKLGLDDIPGDMVILKLNTWQKHGCLKCVLYTEKIPERSTIASKIGEKEGIDRLLNLSTRRTCSQLSTHAKRTYPTRQRRKARPSKIITCNLKVDCGIFIFVSCKMQVINRRALWSNYTVWGLSNNVNKVRYGLNHMNLKYDWVADQSVCRWRPQAPEIFEYGPQR